MIHCLQRADEVVLLIEGWASASYDGYLKLSRQTTGWQWESVQNYLLSAQQAGVRIYLTTNESETVRCLLGLRDYYQKPRHLALLKMPRLVPKSSHWRSLNVLAAVEGVDFELGTRLLNQFGSVRKVLNATEEDLRSVPGIGVKRAKSIRKILDEVWSIKPELDTKYI